MKIKALGIVFLMSTALLIASNSSAFAQDEGPSAEITWAVGLNANFPFLGVSTRFWLDEMTGFEINLAPLPQYDYRPIEPPPRDPDGGNGDEDVPRDVYIDEPTGPNRLDVHLSGRYLRKVSDNNRADFLLSIGPAVTLSFSQINGFSIEEPFLALLGEIEISNWPIERINPVIDYGFALNLRNLYDFRWIAGGIGFHFYFF